MSLERNQNDVSLVETVDATSCASVRVVNLPRYVDLKTAGVMMSLSEATTRRLVESGKMPAIRIPPVKVRKPEQKKTLRSKDIIRIDVRDIDGFMRRHKKLC